MHDEALVGLFLARDERAIAEVKTKYGKLCEQAALDVLGDRHAAEEAFSDALMALWTSIPPERPRSVKAYVLSITKRRALNAARERGALKRGGGIKAESLDELMECLPAKQSADAQLEARALCALLNRWLETLKAEDRALFLKRYWFDESISELSERLGISSAQVSNRLYSLRKRLKKSLEKDGFFV